MAAFVVRGVLQAFDVKRARLDLDALADGLRTAEGGGFAALQGGLAIRIAYVAAAPAVAVGMAVSFAFAAFCGNAQGYAVLACTGGDACGGIVVLVVVVFVMFFAGGVEVDLVFGFEVGTHFARHVRAGDVDVRLRTRPFCLQVHFAAGVDGTRGEGVAVVVVFGFAALHGVGGRDVDAVCRVVHVLHRLVGLVGLVGGGGGGHEVAAAAAALSHALRGSAGFLQGVQCRGTQADVQPFALPAVAAFALIGVGSGGDVDFLRKDGDVSPGIDRAAVLVVVVSGMDVDVAAAFEAAFKGRCLLAVRRAVFAGAADEVGESANVKAPDVLSAAAFLFAAAAGGEDVDVVFGVKVDAFASVEVAAEDVYVAFGCDCIDFALGKEAAAAVFVGVDRAVLFAVAVAVVNA